MKQIYYLIIAAFLLASCQPSESTIQTAIAETQVVWTPIPTQTFYPTTTPVVVTKIVTPTFTFTPQYTPTITNTPVPTNTKTSTPDPRKVDKGNGFYLVNVDIAPGVWRSSGTGDGCYWSVTTKTGDIIDNHFGMAGGTAYIPTTGFQVEFDDCGTWTFISDP